MQQERGLTQEELDRLFPRDDGDRLLEAIFGPRPSQIKAER